MATETTLQTPVKLLENLPVGLNRETLTSWLEQRQLLHEVIRSVLVPGTDYTVLPGTTKPTLLQPGAEKLAYLFNCAVEFSVVDAEIDHDRENSYERQGKTYTSHGLYRYIVKCEIRHRGTGLLVGTGLGLASTLESRYISRPRDLENTILKMAAKRALVHAVSKAFALSDQFTQDLEDVEAIEPEPSLPPNKQQSTDTKPPKAQPQPSPPKAINTSRLLAQAGLSDEEIEELAEWAKENEEMTTIRDIVRQLADAGELSRKNLSEALAILGYTLSA